MTYIWATSCPYPYNQGNEKVYCLIDHQLPTNPPTHTHGVGEGERKRMRAQGNCLSLVTSPDKGWAESCVFGNLHAEFGCRFEVSRFNRRLVSVSPCKGVEEVALDKQRS